MELQFTITMNEKLFVRDPLESELGRKILGNSIVLIQRVGYEAFTFKKLANEIHTTEAGVYRYFENKHRLLLYIVDWYWSWQEHRVLYHTQSMDDPSEKLRKVIKLFLVEDKVLEANSQLMNEKLIYDIVVYEGAKVYLTQNITEDNKAQLFKPYKDLCNKIAEIISEIDPGYKYPRSLATIIIEMSHSLRFYKKNLPSLTDFGSANGDAEISVLIEDLVFATLKRG